MTVAPFSKALYYPWIDIRDNAWLKSALLYWDKIQTIVPESEKLPYSSVAARKFQEAGLLVPYRVTPEETAVRSVADKAIEYLHSPEGVAALTWDGRTQISAMDARRMAPKVRRLAMLRNEKISWGVVQELVGKRLHRPTGDYVPVDARFGNYYMTLLATEIAEESGAGLLTDLPSGDRLASSARTDALRGLSSETPEGLRQGVVAELVLKGLRVDPSTPVERILRFRREYKTELGRFRTRVAEVAKDAGKHKSLEALLQWGHDANDNILQPEFVALRECLRGSSIKHGMDTFLKVAGVNVGAGALAVVLLGLSTPMAVVATAGVSLTAGAIAYSVEKSKVLRESPYTYLLKVKKELR